MKYLYIFEDGRVGIADTQPTKVDLDTIEDGLLQVFRIDDQGTILEQCHTGSFMDADRCELQSHGGETFHVWVN